MLKFPFFTYTVQFLGLVHRQNNGNEILQNQQDVIEPRTPNGPLAIMDVPMVLQPVAEEGHYIYALFFF